MVTPPPAMKPCPMAAATLSEMNAPTKLSIDASATARPGASARVETEVATTSYTK